MTLLERMEFLLNNEKASDITFIVGDKDKGTVERIPAISSLLMAASEVFHAMFTGDLPRPQEEYVPDAEPAAFRIMLRYIHTDKLDVGLDYALPLLYLAKKYMLTNLSNEVVQTVSKLLTAQNVCQLLQSAGLAEEIRDMCSNLIAKESSEVLNSDAFFSSSALVVADILRMDSLHIREHDAFAAIIEWSKRELSRQSKPISASNVRDVLGDVLYLIRFPLMSAFEFGATGSIKQLLTVEERLSVLQWFATGVKPEKFSCVQRATKPAWFSVSFPLIDFTSFVKDKGEDRQRSSEPVAVGFLKWRIAVYVEKGDPNHLGVYVKANHTEDKGSWVCDASFTLRILSQRFGTRDIVEHVDTSPFGGEEPMLYGNSQLAAIRDLLNPAKGFLKNDTIILTADIFPKNGDD